MALAIDPGANDLTIVREFNAPRALVFKAWTDPARVARWLGPHGAPAVSFEGTAEVGGAYRGCLKNPETEETYWHSGTYREVTAPERIVMTFRWEEDDAPETLITITLDEVGGKTRMTFHQAPFATTSDRDGHGEGWDEAFERLGTFLSEAA